MEGSEKMDEEREGGEEELVWNAVTRSNLAVSSLRSALLQLRDHHSSLH